MKEGDKFEVEYSEYALEFLKKADKQLKKRIVKKIEYLAKNISVDVKHRQSTHRQSNISLGQTRNYLTLFQKEYNEIMANQIVTISKKESAKKKLEELKVKASILDELVELIEDRYLGYLMKLTEKEKNIPLKKAKKLLR